jgi:hypothetical protein
VKDHADETQNDSNNNIDIKGEAGKINIKSVAKNYDSGKPKFLAGHSITARSISRNIRQELK